MLQMWMKMIEDNNMTVPELFSDLNFQDTVFVGKLLDGEHVRIGTVQNYPLSYAEMENDTLVGKGVAFDFVNYLQAKLGFTYSVILPESKQMDSEDGVVGLLNANKVDMVAAFLHNEYFANLGFDTSNLLDMARWMVMMRRPTESATGSGLTAPFEWNVWLIIIISLIFIGPIMHCIINFRARLLNDRQEYSGFTVFQCSWFAYGALLKQGSTLNPKSDTTRILFATWWIFIVILTAFYTANLTAFLTLSQFKLPLNSPEDIGEKHYNWIAEQGDPIINVAEDPDQYLYSVLEGSKGLSVDLDRMNIIDEYVYRKNFIFIAEQRNIQRLMYTTYLDKTKQGLKEEDRCAFVMTSWDVGKLNRVFVFGRNFTYSRLITRKLLSLSEGGMVLHKLTQGLPGTDICPLNLGSKGRQLRNTDLLLTYYLVAGGYVIALTLFLVENLISRTRSEDVVDRREKYIPGGTPEMELPPPPSYQALFGEPFRYKNGTMTVFNGRDYWVIKSNSGRRKLIPVRNSSAILYHYKHYE